MIRINDTTKVFQVINSMNKDVKTRVAAVRELNSKGNSLTITACHHCFMSSSHVCRL